MSDIAFDRNTAPGPHGHPGWQQSLEIIGAELFQRYRKRLMSAGISIEIWRDYPGLALVDVLVRVHAGRRIIQAGDDFVALQAIRSGRWQACSAGREQPYTASTDRPDRLSRILVRAGGLLFVAFCALSLVAMQT